MNETLGAEWYFTRGGETEGPVAFSELKIKAGNYMLKPPVEMVWTEGMADWKPVAEVEGLAETRGKVLPQSEGEPAKNQWFYLQRGEHKGPVSLAEMKKMVSDPTFDPPVQMVWTDGMDRWLPVYGVPALCEPVPGQEKPAARAVVEIKPVVVDGPDVDPVEAVQKSEAQARAEAEARAKAAEEARIAAEKAKAEEVAKRKEAEAKAAAEKARAEEEARAKAAEEARIAAEKAKAEEDARRKEAEAKAAAEKARAEEEARAKAAEEARIAAEKAKAEEDAKRKEAEAKAAAERAKAEEEARAKAAEEARIAAEKAKAEEDAKRKEAEAKAAAEKARAEEEARAKAAEEARIAAEKAKAEEDAKRKEAEAKAAAERAKAEEEARAKAAEEARIAAEQSRAEDVARLAAEKSEAEAKASEEEAVAEEAAKLAAAKREEEASKLKAAEEVEIEATKAKSDLEATKSSEAAISDPPATKKPDKGETAPEKRDSKRIWFYIRDSEQEGPVTFEELRALAVATRLNPRMDMVWNDSLPEWKQAGEIEGLYDRTGTAQEKSVKSLAPPAAALGKKEQGKNSPDKNGKDSGWPGMRRRYYIPTTVLFPIVWSLAVGFCSPILIKQYGEKMMAEVLPYMGFIPFIAVGFFMLKRLKNLGMGAIWFLAVFVPFLNFWLGFRCFACPAGYAYHKKMDGIGIALAILYWLVILSALLLGIAAVALSLGLLENPELQQQLREMMSTSLQPAG
jgi:hypothetical protein